MLWRPILTENDSIDGIFRLLPPRQTLEFTGERMTRAIGGQIEFEHFHRYCMARDLCNGLDVLDVASGEGYGSAVLASLAKSVIGVEIDNVSTEHAQVCYQSHNLKFLQGNALELPLDDASVDAVVSFETLEHLREHLKFIVEIKRVLRPGGRLIISTPDRTIYAAQHFNQFHMRELSYLEFESLLRSKFANVVISHQRAILGSLITFPEVIGSWRSYERRDPEHIEASNGLSRAPYLIGIASNSELPPLPSSAYVDLRSAWEAANALVRTSELDLQLDDAKSRVAELECERDEFQSALVDHRARAADALLRTSELELQLDDAKSRVAELECQRDEFQSALVDHRARAADLERRQERRVRAAEEVAELKNGQLAELQQRLAELQQRRAELQQRLAELQQRAEVEHKFLQLAIPKDEHTRQLARLARRCSSLKVPKELRGFRPFLLGRRRKYKRLVKNYRTIASSALFDSNWYRSTNPDISNANVDPAFHYLMFGAKEGRAPGPYFDGAKYQSANHDVLLANINPLIHYVTFGHTESRPLHE